MTIMQYWILGWIAVGVFAIFAIIWLFGLITAQPRLRFVCDFALVIALFGMMVGFGGRYKQLRLARARQEAAALKKKNLHKAETAFKATAQEAYQQIDAAGSDISSSWSKAISDAKKAAKTNKSKKSAKGKKKIAKTKVPSPNEAVNTAFKKHKKALAKAQTTLTGQGTNLTKIYKYGSKANYQKYQLVEKKEVAYYNAIVTINKLTLPKYQAKIKTAKTEYLAAWKAIAN